MKKQSLPSPEHIEQAKKYEKLWKTFEKANDAWFAAGCPEGPLCEAWENAWVEYHR